MGNSNTGITRRRVLGAIAAGTALTGSGCLGDSPGSPGGGTEGSPTDSSSRDTPNDTGTSPPRADPDALSAPYLGARESGVVVRAWEDFGCPHCRTYNDRVKPRLEENYLSKDAVRYEHHDYPIPASEWSWPAAIAARSVQSHAGDDAFWTFLEGAFENQDSLEWSTIETLAEEAGADPETVVDEARENYWRPVVAADKTAGSDRGVSGTPTVFVDDQQVSGSTWDEFYANIAGAIDDRKG